MQGLAGLSKRERLLRECLRQIPLKRIVALDDIDHIQARTPYTAHAPPTPTPHKKEQGRAGKRQGNSDSGDYHYGNWLEQRYQEPTMFGIPGVADDDSNLEAPSDLTVG